MADEIKAEMSKEPLDLKKAYSLLVKMLFVVTGATIVSSAFVFLGAHDCFSCLMVYWIPGTDILATWVYPFSVMIIGASLIFYGLKFGIRGLGLVIMVCGAYDVLAEFAAVYWWGLLKGQIGAQDQYFWVQNVLLFGGYVLAGFPKLRLDRWVLLPLAVVFGFEFLSVYGIWSLGLGGGLYTVQFFEIALFVYVFKTTTFRDFRGLVKRFDAFITGGRGF